MDPRTNIAPILETKDLTRQLGGLTVIDKVSVAIPKGRITSIIGPNGAGKTTFFNLLTGFLKPMHGDVYLLGRRITGFPPHEIVRMGMTRSFQLIRVFPRLSVLDNVVLGIQGLKGDAVIHAITKDRVAIKQFSDAKNAALEVIGGMGLAEYADFPAGRLSYGQQKLVEISRALISEPQVILLDEPMAGLSMTMIDQMIGIIQKIKDQGKTVVLVEHNVPVVMDISDRIVVLSFGKTLAAGSPEEIKNNPEVVDAYLGV